MQAPRNRQEFLAMQQQAAAAARDMQRRATLPMPPVRSQGSGFRVQEERRPPEPLHHRSPSQQARQYASYGRMQPQMRRQEWQQPRNQGRGQPQQRQAKPPPPAPPPPPAAASMPPLADLLGLLGGLGGLGGAPKQESPESELGANGSMDSIMMILLLFLLQKENADQGLLLALMYIMM